MAERTCIVTRQVRDPEDLIRFVAGPDGQVVPDMKHNLPGRGVWVGNSRKLVDEAAKKNLFARGLRTKVKTDAELGALVDSLMEKTALGALGFAKKAGECVTGSGKVESTVSTENRLAFSMLSTVQKTGCENCPKPFTLLNATAVRKLESGVFFQANK